MNLKSLLEKLFNLLKGVEAPPQPVPPPDPIPGPKPAKDPWKCSMFFPYAFATSGLTPPWPGNNGVDSLLDFVDIHGESWEKDKRRNGYAQIQKLGGDCALFIAEKLFNNWELAMFLTNTRSPIDGHQMNDEENEVVIARKCGVNRWIVSLFNDGESSISPEKHQEYINQIGAMYAWASPEQVAMMVCLETDERFTIAQTIERAIWIFNANPGKRIIVGSANPAFLKLVAAEVKKLGGTIELWLETDWNPITEQHKADWSGYQANLADLLKIGMPVWAGEYWQAQGVSNADVSAAALKMGCVGVGSYSK